MKILIAEDDAVSRRLLGTLLAQWGYESTVVADGAQAWAQLTRPDGPRLAILDWMMPQLDGIEVCHRLRRLGQPSYIILLTARDRKEDVLAGLESGADDYLIKPFDHDELKARLRTGVRILELQESLARRVQELEAALAQVKKLQGMLPICAWCKKVRNDQNYWQQIEEYLGTHTHAHFTHGICPECMQKELDKNRRAGGLLETA